MVVGAAAASERHSVMAPEEPESRTPEYAHRSGWTRRPKSLLEVTGFHFVASNGIATLAAVALLLMRRSHDYPLTTACGGTFVVVIQAGLLAVGAGARQIFSGRLLEARKTSLTLAAGVLGAVLVFGLPFAVSWLSDSEVAYIVATLLTLVFYPLAASAFVFVRSGDTVRRAT
jgi:hypothetical protein